MHTVTGSLDTVVSYNVPLDGGAGWKLQENEWVKVGQLSLEIADWAKVATLNWHCNNVDFPFVVVNGIENNALFSATYAPGGCTGENYDLDPNLAVELSSFNGKLLENRSVLLDWSTLYEADLESFQVERSLDGENYIALGAVTPSGNSSVLQTYDFTDPNPQNGSNYYRLKILHESGEIEYSKIVLIEIDRDLGLSISPNPASDFISVSLMGQAMPKLNLNIYNLVGQVIYQQQIEKTDLLDLNFELDVTSWAAGTYFFSLTNKEYSIHRPFVITHTY